jgi:RimJ/RimL family protein N-acetyltransferase
MTSDYEIQTERLLLRPPIQSDAVELWPLVSDIRLTTFLAWAPHRELIETVELIVALQNTMLAENGFHWVAVHGGKIVGLVSLIDVRRQHRCWTIDRAELAYWIGLPYHGNGFATEAAAAAIRFGFEKLKLHKIRVFHAADNPASGRTIEKLGFRYVGQEVDAFQKDGVWHHLNHFEKLV